MLRFVLAALLLLAAALPLTAQETLGPNSARLDALVTVLDDLERTLADGESIEAILEDVRSRALAAAMRAREIAAELAPRAANLQARLDQLAPAPAGEGEAAPAPEADPLADERARQEAALAAVESRLRLARAVATRAEQVAAAATAVARERFAERIFRRSSGLLSPQLWATVRADLPAAAAALGQLAGAQMERFGTAFPGALAPILILLAAIGSIAVPRLRHALVDLAARGVGQDHPTPVGRAIVAALVGVIVSLVPALGFWAALSIARSLDLVARELVPVGEQSGMAVLVIAAGFALTRAVLAPNRPAWRLAPLDDEAAERLAQSLPMPLLFIALGLVLNGLAVGTSIPLSLTVAGNGLVSLSFAVTLILSMHLMRRVLMREEADGSFSSQMTSGLVRLANGGAVLAGFVIVAAAIFGYAALAWFLAQQVVWVAVVAVTFFILTELVDAAYQTYFAPRSPAAARLARSAGLRPGTMAQIGLLGSGLIKGFAVLTAALAIAAPWGISSASLLDQLRSALTGFEIGNLTISVTAIASATILFFVGVLLTRALQGWLSNRYLPATRLDPGLKSSVTIATGYVGFIAAFVIAFAYLGIDLSQLALVAGALSVGIGFGLQSVVNNFVSGLILLVERPIKTGDWIMVGGEEGIVKRIKVRATELETFDRASVVIPNSDLISGTVKNWVLGDTMGRASVTVGVGYASDAEEVRELLLGCARQHPLVLDDPEPRVVFMDFGDNALIFRLDAFLADISMSLSVRSDLRFALLKRLRESGIEIPFPQRDLHIRTTPDLRKLVGNGDAGADRNGGDGEAEADGDSAVRRPVTASGRAAAPRRRSG
jgi:potassium-dependent mechanosensitive channel